METTRKGPAGVMTFFITRMGGALRSELGTGTHGASLDNGRGRD